MVDDAVNESFTTGYLVFDSPIIGDFNPTVWCLYGRDGVNLSDWTVSMVDDAECSSVTEVAFAVKRVADAKIDSFPFQMNMNSVSWLIGGVISLLFLFFFVLHQMIKSCGEKRSKVLQS